MNKIPIAEIFGPTIQGEGPNIGARCMFVRVKGCDYRCSWCDSKYTWHIDDNTASKMDEIDLADYILSNCISNNCKHVVLTGGNPCLYDFSCVISCLSKANIQVDVETQGSIIPHWLHSVDTVVFSPKCPSSGMKDSYDNIASYVSSFASSNQTIAIKIPVFNSEDIDFCKHYADFVNKLDSRNVRMYLSVGNTDVTTSESIRDRVLSDYQALLTAINNNADYFQNIYLLPQLHTLVWGNKQGV